MYRTPFIAREQELERLQQLVDGGSARVITVMGAAGCGKSRLVEQFADQSGRAAVWRTPGSSGGLPPVDLDLLAPGALLVLDDIQFGNPGLDAWLDAAAALDVTVIATSMDILGVRGEAVLALAPLARARGDQDPRAGAAGKLFQARLGRRLLDEELDAAGRIAAGAGGLPLAIELLADAAADLGLDAVDAALEEALGALRQRGARIVRAVVLEVARDVAERFPVNEDAMTGTWC